MEKLSPFKDCYVMQRADLDRFAATLADGFSQYDLFRHICGRVYDYDKMSLFWKVSLAILPSNAICIADSKNVNSVLVYIPPKSKEAGVFSYIKYGGLKMLFKLGPASIVRLLRFDAEAKSAAKRYQKSGDGYLMAFATRIDKQGQHYGKPLVQALLEYLDSSGEGCYLETLKAGNVDLYKHFQFQLKESISIPIGNLTMYAMHRPCKQ